MLSEEVKKIGLSLSCCVSGILKGEVDIDDVVYIITGCKEEGLVDGEIQEKYAKLYWRNNKEKGIEICNKLWSEGRLLFPRDQGLPEPNLSEGYWLDYRFCE